MGKQGVLVWSTAALLAACGDDPREVTGRILRENQTGVADQTARLSIVGDSNIFDTTGDDGRFRLSVPSDLPQNSIIVSFSSYGFPWGSGWPASHGDPDNLDMGDIPLWVDNLTVTPQPGGAQVDWDGPFAWFEEPVRYRVHFGAWSEDVGSPGLLFDLRKIQDQTVEVSVSMSTVPDLSKRFLSWASWEPASATGTQIPPSRGAACNADEIMIAAGDCAVTDGDFASFLATGELCQQPNTSCGGLAVTELVVDLGASMPTSAVVIHSLRFLEGGTNPMKELRIETSNDCATFGPVATVTRSMVGGELHELVEVGGIDARCVKIISTPPIESLIEVGVW